MKKISILLFASASAILLSSCAMVLKSPVTGTLYSDVKAPVDITGNTGSSKVGTAEVQSILGLVATGDASIETAAKSAGITKIHHVDMQATSILGIIATYKIYVYGE